MVKSFYKRFLLIVLIVAGIIFLNGYFFDDFLQNLVYKIINRPSTFLTSNLFNFSKYTTGFLKTKEIFNESAELKEENNILRGQLAELDGLKRENKFLRDGLGVARRLDTPLLLVQIFNIQRGAISSTALINRGAKDGIKKSLPAITTGNILVGIVDQIFNDSALILLLDDPRVKISGRIQKSNTLVETKGRLRNELGLDLIAYGDEVKNGDTTVTSGLDGLPEALLIAKVTKIEIPSGAPFKSVTAKPFFDPSLGSSLFVILK